MNKELLDRHAQRYLEFVIAQGEAQSLVQFFFPDEDRLRVEYAAIEHEDQEQKSRSLSRIRRYANQANPAAVQIVLDVWLTVIDRHGSRKTDGLFICNELASGHRWGYFAEVVRDGDEHISAIRIMQEIFDQDELEGWEIFDKATIQ